MVNNKITTNTTIGGGSNRIVIKYQGFTQTKTTDNLNTQVTYQSTKEGIEHFLSSETKWKIGTVDDDWGRLDSINSQPGDGPFWNAILTYNKPLQGIYTTTGGSDDNKPQQNSLTVRIVSMPIQSHKNYKKIWNNYLIGRGDLQDPPTLETVSGLNLDGATALINAHPGQLRWVKSDSDLPTQPEMINEEPVYWKILVNPTKLGVETYDMPTYEISQTARHSDRQNAAWSLATKSGKLKFPGGTGDFGLEAKTYPSSNNPASTPPCYHWLCQGGNLNFDGKYWNASCTYQWSPEDTGWDQQIYDVAQDYGWSNKDKNSIFEQAASSNNNGNVTNPVGGN